MCLKQLALVPEFGVCKFVDVGAKPEASAGSCAPQITEMPGCMGEGALVWLD